jgi:hypothetical protein
VPTTPADIVSSKRPASASVSWRFFAGSAAPLYPAVDPPDPE